MPEELLWVTQDGIFSFSFIAQRPCFSIIKYFDSLLYTEEQDSIVAKDYVDMRNI